MLWRELYLWLFAKKLYHSWITTIMSSNDISWKLPPETKSWLCPCTSLYLFCPPSSCTYNSHTIKYEVFLHTSSTCLILVWFSKFKLSSLCLPSQLHTFSAQLLFDETFTQPHLFAVVNYPVIGFECGLLNCFNAQPYDFAVVSRADVALSVFYSLILTRCQIFLHSWTALSWHWVPYFALVSKLHALITYVHYSDTFHNK